MTKKYLIIFLVVILALLPGCTSKPNKKSDVGNKQAITNGTDQPQANTETAYENVKITPQQAFDTFTKKFPTAKVEKLEFDFEQGSSIYELEGYDDTKKYELKIDPIDGSIIKAEEKVLTKGVNNKGEITLQHVNKIDGLIDKTLKDAGPDFKVEEWTLESKNNQPILEIEVINDKGRDIEYKYNVMTGELLEKD